MAVDLPPNRPKPSADLVPIPETGRVFTLARRVSIDDAAPDGRAEFDAIARILQDAGNDDTDDAGLDQLGLAWVARRMVVEVLVPAQSRELLAISTWCSGTGRRWAERRTQLLGDRGAVIEAAAVWVHIDVASGRISPWGERFASYYLEAAGGRQIDTKLHHPKDVADLVAGANQMPFRFRQSDMDGFGHVNNAAYLAVLEEALGGNAPPSPLRIEIEWRKPSIAGEELTVVESVDEAGVRLWITAAETGELRATIFGMPLRG